VSVINPRKRLVYFRLSEEEFERATNFCEPAGARSISDLARIAVEQFLTGMHGANRIDGSLQQLNLAVSELNERLRELTSMLRAAESRDGQA
jgi:hypothetical protein